MDWRLAVGRGDGGAGRPLTAAKHRDTVRLFDLMGMPEITFNSPST
jgi:hypothetical protein